MSVVRFKFRCNILISGNVIKEIPGSVARGTHCIYYTVGYFVLLVLTRLAEFCLTLIVLHCSEGM